MQVNQQNAGAFHTEEGQFDYDESKFRWFQVKVHLFLLLFLEYKMQLLMVHWITKNKSTPDKVNFCQPMRRKHSVLYY